MADLYSTDIHVTGGRDGRATSDDGRLDVALAPPGSGTASNPEQLFGAGFGACFTSSLIFAAKQRKLDPGAVTVLAKVTLTASDAGSYGLRVRLAATLPGLAPSDAQAVLAEAERICAYSNATRGNVSLEVVLA